MHLLSIALVLSIGFGITTPSQAVEIGVRSVLIPQNGIDESQPAIAMLQGELPSVCHSLGETRITDVSGVLKGFLIEQYAVRREDGDCAPDSGVMHIQKTVPFSIPVSFGKLSAGEYSFAYRRSPTEPGSFNSGWFKISATTPNQDYSRLAQIRSIQVPVQTTVGSPLSITLEGTLTNPCVQIARISVVHEKDTYLVSLTPSMDPELVCAQQITAFSETLTLTDSAEAGEFLVHASVPGTPAVQKVFNVQE